MASLDILQPAPPGGSISRSRSSRWRLAVLTLVHLIIAAHITHWLVTGRSVTPVEPSEAIAFSASGVVNAGLIFFAVSGALTLFFGRFFCGWACHLVALQDLSSALLARVGIRPRPLRSRLLAFVPLIAFLWAFVLPAVLRWRRDRLQIYATEWTTEHFWQTFPGWFVGGLTFFVCGFAIVYLLGAKGFCTYACPYGALYGAVDRLAPMRIRVNDACEGCGHCTAVCTSNVRVHQEVRDFGMVVDPGCMKCLDCVSVCPKNALSYSFGRPALLARPRADAKPPKAALRWSEEIVLATGFALGYLAVRGAYGATPLLLSLGLAACVGFAALMAWRLVRQPQVKLHRWQLRLDGALTGRGRLAVAALTALTLVLGHTAWLKWELIRGDRLYRALIPAVEAQKAAALDPELAVDGLPAEARASAVEALNRYDTIRRFGISPGVGPVPRSAWLHFLLGDRDRAMAQAQRAIDRYERPWDMHELLGAMAADRGDWAAAADAFEAGWRERPSRNLAVRFADASSRLRRFGEAAEMLAATEQRFGAHPETRYALALVATYAGDLTSAESNYRWVVERQPDNLQALENLAGLMAQAGNWNEARDLFRRALTLREDPETRFLLARVLLAAGDFGAAREEISRLESAGLPTQVLDALRDQLP